jgi:hypothetical protein
VPAVVNSFFNEYPTRRADSEFRTGGAWPGGNFLTTAAIGSTTSSRAQTADWQIAAQPSR